MPPLYGNLQLTGVERSFEPDEIIVSKTDLTGKITYANRTFLRMAGVDEDHCLGIQHNLIRHPDMPRCVFKLLWDTLQDGKELFAYVINRSVNGDHYWVMAHVTPSFDGSGNICGYHSNRRVPRSSVVKEHIVPLYKSLLSIEKEASGPDAGITAAYAKVKNLLAEKKCDFNEMMFSLGM
jgi:PAS domain S-box-containing protein